MAYTSTVPQANQAISTTQPIIQANFGFLAASIGQEHNFNAAGSGTDTYHLKASMPSQADPAGALTSPITGVYYVSGGAAKYYNNTQVGGNLLGAVNMQINFSGTGANGNLNGGGGNTIRGSFNVNTATCTKDATGLYTIQFTNPLPSTNGVVLITGMRGAANEVFGFIQGSATLATSFTTAFIKIGFQSSNGTANNVILGSVIIMGC